MTRVHEFKLPDLGEGSTESEIAAWRVAVGDTVQEDQPLVDMLTDKAAVEIPSPVSGIVRELRGAVGQKIAVGAVLVVIQTDADAPAPAVEVDHAHEPCAPREPCEPHGPASQPESERAAPVAAAPAVRRRARELGVDLRDVTGSGPHGRVLHEDLDRHVASARRAEQAAHDIAHDDADDAIERIPMHGLRRKISQAMQRALRIPHFSYVEEVDVTELEALRAQLNTQHAQRAHLTVLPLLVRALVCALRAHPQLNATFDEDAQVIARHRDVHLGIATQTPQGLVVPVLRHAQRLDPWQCADEIRRLANAARDGRARAQDLRGSTLTLTSLGALGGIASTPILNAPEVAIVGANRIAERAVVRAGRVEVRRMMNLSSSFDHRIVDGHAAAAFIQELKRLIEHPALMFVPAPG